MTALLPQRRRAERFEALVGDPARTPEPAGELTPLVRVVSALRTVAEDEVLPDPAYVADLRSRLMTEAETALDPVTTKLTLAGRPPAAKRRSRRASAALAGVIVAGMTAGVAAASQSALPGDPLYPIKRTIERADASLKFSDQARGEDRLSQAESRLDEVGALLDRPGSNEVDLESALASFQTAATAGSRTLFQDYQRTGNADAIASVREFAGSAMRQLTAASESAAPGERSDFVSAAQVVADIDQQARVLCATCGGPRAPLSLPMTLASSTSDLVTLLADPLNSTGRSSDPAGGRGSDGSAASGGAEGGQSVPSKKDIDRLGLDGVLGATGSDGAGTGSGSAGTGSNGSGSSGTPSRKPGPVSSLVPSPLKSILPGTGTLLGTVDDTLSKVTDPLLKP